MAETLVGRGADVALTDAGRSQLPLLARCFARNSLAAIHCSPRRRTRETAQVLAMQTGAPLILDPAFDEIDFGDWTGQTFAQLHDDPAWQRWNTARDDAHAANGESMTAAQRRAIDAIERLARDYPEQEVAIVTHAEIVRAVLLHCLGLPLSAYTRIDVSPASRSLIELAPSGDALTLSRNRERGRRLIQPRSIGGRVIAMNECAI